MVTITVDLPNEVARSITHWLAPIVELSRLELRTQAATVANETTRFLLADPSADDVLQHKLSSTSQSRVRQLLALNQADLLGETEHRELDEMGQIEHIMQMTKLKIMAEKRV